MLLILLGLLCAVAAPVRADEGEPYVGSLDPGRGTVGFRVELYNNPDDAAGNPFLDEELTVIEPAIVLDYNVSDRLSVHGQFNYDYVSSASIKRLSNYPEQSGASGDYYYGLNLGLNYEVDSRTRVGGFTSASIEYDYFSFGLGGDIARDAEDHSSTLKLTTNGYFDVVKVIRYNGRQEGNDSRISLSSSLAWYQIINRDTHGELGATVSFQSGFLETAFNAVVIEDDTLAPNPALENLARGYEITEQLPDTRVRSAVFGQVRRSLGQSTSAGLHGRAYVDSWGIQSFSVEPRLYRWILRDRLNMRLRYRYYTQTAADAYAKSFTAETEERTQDSDLAEFDSHGAGVRLEVHLDEIWTLDVLADYTWRSDGIDQLFGGTGIRRSF
jgi:hypothetical protein